MKKIIIYVLVILSIFMFDISTTNAASNSVNDFKMDIYIDENGNANITETWDAVSTEGTEFYHTYEDNINNSEFFDFSVTMDGIQYQNIGSWDIDASLEEKAYKNGIHYNSNNYVELCFGKTSLGKHTYIVKYTITNFILKLADADMAFWQLIPNNTNGEFKNITINISSFKELDENVQFWKFGYDGTIELNDGKIEIKSNGVLDGSERIMMILKFPMDTFISENVSEHDFNYYYEPDDNSENDFPEQITSVNKLSMDIYIDEHGNANVTEVWDAFSADGTEFYHTYENKDNSEFLDFSVTMDGVQYQNIDSWNIDASLEEKAYKNGINYNNNNNVELCFGKSSLGAHQYVLKYTITNFILKLTDADMLNKKLLLSNNNGLFKDVTIKISSFFPIDSNTMAWQYGNKGEISIDNGIIEIKSNGKLNYNEYVLLIIKFPQNTFSTMNTSTNSFDYYLNTNNDNSFYTAPTIDSKIKHFSLLFIFILIGLLIATKFSSFIESSFSSSSDLIGSFILNYGKKGNELKNDLPSWREIPCNKDIYEAFFLSRAFNLTKSKSLFLGVLILKWVDDETIKIRKVKTKIFNIKRTFIDFSEATFENESEADLYELFKEQTDNGVLKNKDFKKICKDNYSYILKLFDHILDYAGEKLIEDKYLIETEKDEYDNRQCKVTSKMFKEAEKLCGLKKFLLEYSSINEKDVLDVKIWDEYLLFAQLFGIADKVSKQFNDLHPEVKIDNKYSDIEFAFDICSIAISCIESADRSRSGGSSFFGSDSSSGGGGGSFGGGSSSSSGGMGSR